ncbi:MAG: DNA-protecting protein DprA [Firmicutes bacterium]|nr:DNA-protecting protein DprA [Bacillota bacterium]
MTVLDGEIPEKAYWLALNRIPGLGPVRLRSLLSLLGSGESVWKAPAAALGAARGLGDHLAAAVAVAREGIDPRAEWERAQRLGANVLTLGDPEYPGYLKAIHDPPPVLYLKGSMLPEDDPAVAIVGTRRATAYGLKTARRLAAELASLGVTVVSGLARGIDGAAHEGALEAGGRTLAVLGCGIDIIYPREHRELYRLIPRNGTILSEFPPETAPESHHFPGRNRIISGLSRAVVVIEAGEGSGALITTDFALEQGREVLAVPGPITSSRSRGCHDLIKQGARLVQGIEDILEELGSFGGVARERAEARRAVSMAAGKGGTGAVTGFTGPGIHVAGGPIQGTSESFASSESPESFETLSEPERALLAKLGDDPVHIDRLAEAAGIPGPLASALLTGLELRGLVVQIPGKLFRLPAGRKAGTPCIITPWCGQDPR